MWTHLKRRVDEDYHPEPIADPVFPYHTESYILRTATWLERFGVLPEAGGLNDQEKTWVEAMELYFGMDAQTRREYAKFKEENPVA